MQPLDYHHLGVHPDIVIRANERGLDPFALRALRADYAQMLQRPGRLGRAGLASVFALLVQNDRRWQ